MASTANKEYILDVRGEECPIPEMKAAKELQKIDSGKLIVFTDHEPAIDVTLPSLCKSLGLKYEVVKDGEYVKFVIYKEKGSVKVEELEGVSETERIYLRPIDIREKLANPALLMSFVPQVKAVDSVAPGSYILHMKWFINWETPLFVTFNPLPRGDIVYYTAYQKLPLTRISFGWRFVSNRTGNELVIDITEWYKGPFSGQARKSIKKHMEKAGEVLPRVLQA
ncbi:sulfurtransferase TusA family protein [Metallosphaera tengchongensis]|uniref:Sulfurtransferase TusA family protein n=1 Tax=Metallosphaera tengchongensis TaxID=1532350 RepID=A0A6N0NYS1_9CREN|nr:sulfurtransferase TusA family protein [Metallosphaera tengchongensis]QKR00240.1 sulfurtransferase TusA family protein [Metallosphaera tengchongensis]